MALENYVSVRSSAGITDLSLVEPTAGWKAVLSKKKKKQEGGQKRPFNSHWPLILHIVRLPVCPPFFSSVIDSPDFYIGANPMRFDDMDAPLEAQHCTSVVSPLSVCLQCY